ncbi:RL6 [Enterospora canceri]|uniref:RL6 n=1 Tax=Enterospora canceri TaxID=1081671 RepID=A0A1Y1S651_9MICR|nr:RL6 [Enterospora canceri]
MLKKATFTISNFIAENKFKLSDFTEAERIYMEKHGRKTRTTRKDLKKGDLVVVTEGEYAGKKCVFLEQTENNLAAVTGISAINGVGAFLIDELYLFKLSIQINASGLQVPKGLIETKRDADALGVSKIDTKIEQHLVKEVAKVEFLKGYISTPFQIDRNVEFYSQKY